MDANTVVAPRRVYLCVASHGADEIAVLAPPHNLRNTGHLICRKLSILSFPSTSALHTRNSQGISFCRSHCVHTLHIQIKRVGPVGYVALC
jgi:hypothetical protein